MMRKVFIILTSLFICTSRIIANDISFTVSAPDVVVVGEQFRLSYTVTTQKVKDFKVADIKGFDILMGPSRSQQSSTQYINGSYTSTSSITYTYILMATTVGEYTIAGASIIAEDQTLTSESVKIKVLPQDQNNNSGSSNNQRATSKDDASSSSSTSVSNQDIFITATVNKTSVYEQEAFLLTYKIYTAVDLRGFDNIKLPDFTGFHSQEIDLPNDRKWDLERYKDRNYHTTVYRQFVLFPQQVGKLTIDPARFDASIAKVVQVDDPFEAFFNNRSNFIEIKKTLTTPQINIECKPLPTGKPIGFSGGVGEFNISSSINNTNIKTNDAITVKVVISGTGNLKLISDPEIKFPEDFEIYDPKVDNKVRLTQNGLTGNKVIEYLAIPRHAGNYKIPGITFSYFDIRSKTYKTLTTQEYIINVERGEGNAEQIISNFSNKEDLKVLGQDIRYIKQNNIKLSPYNRYFYGSVNYWLWYIIPILILCAVFVVYRQQVKENANIAKMRTKKANKVAVKRLKTAKKLLTENKQEQFYDEVLKTLWGYISDKMSIPVSLLSKDNIEENLEKHAVNKELIKDFLVVLNDCEYARFAPSNASDMMDNVYTRSVDIISKMESSIKRK